MSKENAKKEVKYRFISRRKCIAAKLMLVALLLYYLYLGLVWATGPTHYEETLAMIEKAEKTGRVPFGVKRPPLAAGKYRTVKHMILQHRRYMPEDIILCSFGAVPCGKASKGFLPGDAWTRTQIWYDIKMQEGEREANRWKHQAETYCPGLRDTRRMRPCKKSSDFKKQIHIWLTGSWPGGSDE